MTFEKWMAVVVTVGLIGAVVFAIALVVSIGGRRFP